MTDAPITLPPGCTAEHDTCGSCKFFERDGYDYSRIYGKCRIVLPSKVAMQYDVRAIDPKHKDDEYTGNEDQIQDTNRCDLWRSDGKTYIVQRKILPMVKP